MPNSTTEYWDVNGVSLQTLAQNITTWGGARQGVPPMRGDDLIVPYMPGRRFVRKVPDSRTISLDGWLIGQKTVNSKLYGDVQAARENWRALKKLLWNPRKQINLTRRWTDDNGVLQTATAQAQFTGGMEPEVMAGGSRMDWHVDLFLADPFFYGPEITLTLPRSAAQATILGDYPTLKSRIELVGAQSTTRLATSGDYTHWVEYSTVASGVTAVLDVEEFKATEGSARTSVKVTHSGQRYWFSPEPGTPTITVTGTGTGAIRYIYQPAWI